MPLFTNGFIPRSLASISLAMGDPPKTYSAMFTPSAPAKRIQFNKRSIDELQLVNIITRHQHFVLTGIPLFPLKKFPDYSSMCAIFPNFSPVPKKQI